MFLVSDITAKSAVRIGSIFVPPCAVENRLQSTCKQILVHTNHPEYPYQLLGSMTCIKIYDRYFGVCTGHQISESQFENTSIFIFTKNLTVTASRIYTFDCDEFDLSIRIFEFSEAVLEMKSISNQFFEVSPVSIWPNQARDHFAIFGFPSKFQKVDSTYETKTVVVSAKYNRKSNSPYTHVLEIKENFELTSDGMSGGTVYYMAGYPGDYFIGWAGIVVRGGNPSKYLYFIESGFILEKITEAISQ